MLEICTCYCEFGSFHEHTDSSDKISGAINKHDSFAIVKRNAPTFRKTALIQGNNIFPITSD